MEIVSRVEDKASGRKTLPILLGKNASLTFMAIMYFIAYAFIVLTIIIKPGGSLFYLLALLSFPMPVKVIRRFKKNVYTAYNDVRLASSNFCVES